uniref:Lysosomal amino acid transporter 1 homolog n=1 Tax=Neogobius melanostomus TaxID=47308 RepID=A0A8C6WKG3_9GOBI
MSIEIRTHGGFGWSTADNFSSICPNGSKWVWDILKECADGSRDMASIYLGLLSILCFMISSFPQYYKSCKTGNMDSALSIWFLVLWLAGDSCNMVGSYLANQLPLQTITAVYYVSADLLMLAMYFYYKSKNKRRDQRTLVHIVGMACVIGFSGSLFHVPSMETKQEDSPFRSRALLSVSDDSHVNALTTKEIIGFTIGSISSVLYHGSRLPQIYTNFKRKSTEGVSYFLFALVILGNTLYGLSVLLKNPEGGQGESSYLLHHLPWLIGSLGTLCLDILISIQFFIYRKRPLLQLNHVDETSPLLES